ncbi:MAG: ATP-binding protein [Xanthomonadales bacterium]|nr:ATP-dependent zinc metalloprotease FtsH [Xanthomonadales bacterium]MCC6594706.1 ATP-binding protein [Xanthomonadales bacterium]MCE7932018.1 ATP-binding protein [Xanthomonadales bacterium PRO6]
MSTSVPLPEHLPGWAKRLADLYYAGTSAMFLLHGNTNDLVPLTAGEKPRYGALSEFLANQLFGRFDLVISFDLAHGIKPHGGGDIERQRQMVGLISRRIGDPEKLPRDPTQALYLLDRLVLTNLMAKDGERIRIAILFDFASFVVPDAERGGNGSAANLVTLLKWAANPWVKRSNLAFVLVDERLADFHDRLVSSPHVHAIDLPLPDEAERLRFLRTITDGVDVAAFSDFGVDALAQLTAAVTLADLAVLVESARRTGERLDDKRFKARKKALIERQAQDLLEFVEPKYGLERVVGHDAAKKRLLDDAEIIRRGRLDVAPMGYLFNGPVGTGKTFLATCLAGSIGIPCVKLKNFRSKYVGETEANLERVLGVLRGMGPVMVIIDEADAMLGQREQGGDSGVGSRVFGMIANAMGDTDYRGKILWMLLTARPDLLPIDIKRQGRAEIHIPLFYPQTQDEIRSYFVVIAKKFGAKLEAEDVPDVPYVGDISGADIEALVGRAWREALLAGEEKLGKERLKATFEGFLPSTQSLEREMQEIAAIIECTDRDFLVPSALKMLEEHGNREGLQLRFKEIMRLLGKA